MFYHGTLQFGNGSSLLNHTFSISKEEGHIRTRDFFFNDINIHNTKNKLNTVKIIK